MKIKIKGVEQLTKRLNNLNSSLDKIAKEIIDELAKIGCNNADIMFTLAKYDGVNDVEVDWVSVEKLKVQVRAFGGAVLFIEFGSGIHYYDGYPNRSKVKPAIGNIGSYGNKQGATGKRWFYYGDQPSNPTDSFKGVGETITYTEKRANGKERVRTRVLTANSTKGNQPARAMYGASIQMRNNIEYVIMGVVSKYVGR